MLKEILFQDRTVKAAITGLGGVGKTQLALMLAYQTRAKYKDCSVIWIPASNLESLEQAYLPIAKHLSIVECNNKVDIKRLVQDYMGSESAGRWLLVFDNADDIDMWTCQSEKGSSRLIDYLPRSTQGSIVFTTLDYKIATQLADQNIVEVLQMDELLATQLLQKYLINQNLMNSQQDKEALLAQLTHLPLAIVQAAAYMNAKKNYST